MITGRTPLAAACALIVVSAASLGAQQSSGCRVQLDSVGGTGRYEEIRPGVVRQYGSGGVWASCRNQRTAIYADSVAWYSDLARVDFIGRTRFEDSTVLLHADRASYYTRDERLEAYGMVRLLNLRTGTELRGPNLKYWRAIEGVRDTSDLVASDRPTVWYRQEQERGDTAAPEPYVIVGQRVRLKGEGRAWAAGSVTVSRSDLRASGDSAELDLDNGTGRLLGGAQIEGRGERAYTLSGERVVFRLEERRLRWVQAQGAARAVSEDWDLAADTIEFYIENQRIQNGGAWGRENRPKAVSSSYTMEADSLAIDAPDQRLREIRGFGKALALAYGGREGGEPDWVAGDTLVAHFDTASSGERAMRELDARGHARAYYRVYEEDGRTLAGINYSRGARIKAIFTDGSLHRVHVIGEGDGIYLEPRRRP
ncbi:MAG: hypothetical protein KatS3mg081_0460 [Gemmatimonadales bacterium]|nr:MAG: hypothetical protein KatS3mg081_0460 [Gemmatimonadales bacterium]